eukprot:gnl/Spiro4/27200_TR13529_c0_g1_i1.p1 gnl/Spiro4/27200_TR13529_c0_g1~~gnl/Spiro4/27200_TR13529_c0_g1_i1.p1  ORF type:complete len:259 (+),score=29.11 gnl/Spiro4/27200_TR13529_c0_g1_i1:34-777(+)
MKLALLALLLALCALCAIVSAHQPRRHHRRLAWLKKKFFASDKSEDDSDKIPKGVEELVTAQEAADLTLCCPYTKSGEFRSDIVEVKSYKYSCLDHFQEANRDLPSEKQYLGFFLLFQKRAGKPLPCYEYEELRRKSCNLGLPAYPNDCSPVEICCAYTKTGRFVPGVLKVNTHDDCLEFMQDQNQKLQKAYSPKSAPPEDTYLGFFLHRTTEQHPLPCDQYEILRQRSCNQGLPHYSDDCKKLRKL